MEANWKVHTPNLLKEITFINPKSQPLARELEILGRLLYDVGVVASKLNNPELDKLMVRLTIYDIADPHSKNYNPDAIEDIMKKVDVIVNITHKERNMENKFNHRKKPRKEECRCGGKMYQSQSGTWFCEFEIGERKK